MLKPNLDYYIENGRYILTMRFLRERGKCCENKCRHCPYGVGEGRPDPQGTGDKIK